MTKDTNPETNTPTVRLDKWLWAARFFKTRAVAKVMIEGGKVKYNGERVKPSHLVKVGAQLEITRQDRVQTILVQQVLSQRRPFVEAVQMYQETQQSVQRRVEQQEQRQLLGYLAPFAAPDKRQRQQLRTLRRRQKPFS